MIEKTNIHKGWIILLLSVLTGLACLGFGRFSFGAILPFMKEGLQLNYIQTGWVTSAIFFGYVLSATFAGYFVNLFSSKKVIIFSLCIIIISMTSVASSVGFITAYLSSFFIGVGSGGANVASMGVISTWFASNKRGMALGIVNAGNGLGILFSGIVVPIIVTSNLENGWRISWVILAALVLFISITNFLFLRNSPQELGLSPVGQIDHMKVNDHIEITKPKESAYRNRSIWLLGSIYMLWGFSYIIFSTFLVDYFIQEIALTEAVSGKIFALAGLTSMISGFLWGKLSDEFGRMKTLSIVFSIQMVMLFSFSVSENVLFLMIETVLYSTTLWAVPTTIIASVGDFVEQKQVSVAIGFLTLFFGTGQLIGPIIIGYVLDFTSSYFFAFLLSSLACLVAGILSLLLRKKELSIKVFREKMVP